MTYNIPGTRVLFVFVYVFLLTDDRSDVSAKLFGFVKALNQILDITTKSADTEEKNPTETPLRKVEKTATELLSFRAENFNITIPPSEISIEKRIENETFTERFVYGLKASRLELPCSTGMASQSPFTDFQWSLRNAAINITPTESRLKIGTKKELIFEVLDPMDSGRYTCDGNVNGILHTNIVDLHVYVPADVAMRFPFRFRAAHCNKDENQNIRSQIEKIFCSTFQSCSFEFTTTCSSTPWFAQNKTDQLAAVLEILVVKYTNPSYQPPTCSVDCVMKAKLKNILSEMSSFVTAYKKVGENVRRVGHCAASSCPSDYVFVPEGTTGGSKLLYVCDAGYMLYRISACVPCWAGHFQPSRGPNEDCRTCPILTYQPNPASDSCIFCENSAVNVSIVGAISSDICFPEEKKVKGFFLILFIIFLLGIIATVIVMLIFRKKLMAMLTKTEVSKKGKGGDLKGEKKPLKPGKTPPSASVVKKGSAFAIGRKPSKVVSKVSATKAAVQRRASDFPLMVASSKQGASIPALPVKSAPTVSHDPARIAGFGAPTEAMAVTATTAQAPAVAPPTTQAIIMPVAPTEAKPLTATTALAPAVTPSTTQATIMPVVTPEPAKATQEAARVPVNAQPSLASVASMTSMDAPVAGSTVSNASFADPTETPQAGASLTQASSLAPELSNTTIASVPEMNAPGKQSSKHRNTNQSSRPQSSVTSLRGAPTTLSDSSSFFMTQTTFPAESYKKPPASNIKLHVIRVKPGHEKSQRVANKPADVNSANIPKGLDGGNFKRSPVASPSGDSGKNPSASVPVSTEGDIKMSSAKTSGDTWTNTKPPPTAAITHSTENLKSGIESESRLNKIKSQSGAALNRQMPITETATRAAMGIDPPDSAEMTLAAVSRGTENTKENMGRSTSVDKITNPSPNNNNVNWNAMYSESSWDEEDVELWNSYEVREMKGLVDGADDELDSQQDLAFGTKRRGRKLLKR